MSWTKARAGTDSVCDEEACWMEASVLGVFRSDLRVLAVTAIASIFYLQSVVRLRVKRSRCVEKSAVTAAETLTRAFLAGSERFV